MNYEWVKVVHLLAVISWMAGLLYLPRLMVYHCDSEMGSNQDLVFRVMERRLLKAIMTPASVVALISGGYLVWLTAPTGWWIWVKLAAVFFMFAAHGKLSAHVREFAAGERKHTSRYFRILNEVPTVLMIIIVVMVVVKPF
jgi:protoporphyrinogen IX oxidase